MSPKETARSSRSAQQFHRSAKPGMRPLPELSARDWIGGHRAQSPIGPEDFSGDDLVSLRASELRFSSTAFVGTDLRQADLSGAWFVRCDLREADLTGADLDGARFFECDFTGARLDALSRASATFEHCTGLSA